MRSIRAGYFTANEATIDCEPCNYDFYSNTEKTVCSRCIKHKLGGGVEQSGSDGTGCELYWTRGDDYSAVESM